MDFPFLKRWEVNNNLRDIKSIGASELNIRNVKLWNIVGDIHPFDSPLDILEQPAEMVFLSFWKRHVSNHIVWEEISHATFESLNSFLLNSESHSRIHTSAVVSCSLNLVREE